MSACVHRLRMCLAMYEVIYSRQSGMVGISYRESYNRKGDKCSSETTAGSILIETEFAICELKYPVKYGYHLEKMRNPLSPQMVSPLC